MANDWWLLIPELVSAPVCLCQLEPLLLPNVGFMFKGKNFSFHTKLKSTTSFEAQPEKQRHAAVVWGTDHMMMVRWSSLWQVPRYFQVQFRPSYGLRI